VTGGVVAVYILLFNLKYMLKPPHYYKNTVFYSRGEKSAKMIKRKDRDDKE
jgi:hypothetical protein